MGNERTFDSSDPRVQELRSIRARRGLSLAKTEACPDLQHELNLTAAELEDTIKDELRRMSNHRPVEALRYAFAVRGEPAPTLKERRKAFRARLPKNEQREDDTIEEWENDAIDELLKRLLERKTRRPRSAHYIIAVNATFTPDQDLATLREEHLVDERMTRETISSRTWVNREGEGGLDVGRCFFYECPRLPDENVQVHPILIRLMFSPFINPPSAVYKREGATVMEAQMAQSVELELKYSMWLDGMYYYTYGDLLQSPPAGWVVAFYWEHPSLEGDEHRWRIWRKMGLDLKTGLETSEELPLGLDEDDD